MLIKCPPHLSNLKYICGIDEVGWGCFAGPIVTAGVILPHNFESEYIVDSKLICKSKKKMQNAYEIIMNNAIDVSCNAIQATTINKIGPQPSLDLCIKETIDNLKIEPEYLLIDGNKYKPHNNIPYELIPKGDSVYMNIAAASIVAKYRRDEYMVKVHNKHPNYNFIGNKGYYCKKHKDGLLRFGKSRYHRDKYVNTWINNKGFSLPK